MTPAVFIIEDNFHIEQEMALLGLSLFVFGLGLGPLVFAPLSEQYGRLIVYQTSLFFFCLLSQQARGVLEILKCFWSAGFWPEHWAQLRLR